VEQQFDYLKSESELRDLQDGLYAKTKEALEQGVSPRFKGLLELISSEVTIMTAIHNIKANKGSNTAGMDKKTMQNDILEQDFNTILETVKNQFQRYKPKPVKRVFIPKLGKAEKRPLGIPTIIDRIIQECVRIIIEPICEAQFFTHAYGFRPMRSADMALIRATWLVYNTGYHWIVEGDISKFFDTIHHPTLLRSLWSMGIRDQRVLMIIKQMLKAGVMNESLVSPLGTPQGGIISPLLANVYLHKFDKWVSDQWETKRTKHRMGTKKAKLRALRQRSNLKPAYLVRYADDWILITDSKRNAEKWKWKIADFMSKELYLSLSEEKTFITDVRKRAIHFLGFEFKAIPGKAKTGYVSKTQPDKERLKVKVKDIHKEIRQLRRFKDMDRFVHHINLINAQIRGLIHYYQCTTQVNIALQKYSETLKYAAYKALKRKCGGKWTPAFKYQDSLIGLTTLAFSKYNGPKFKNPQETPYSKSGRQLYMDRTGKRPIKLRADELLSVHLSGLIAHNKAPSLYSFEYFLNRAYAFNRDKGICRICSEAVAKANVHFHHINPKLSPNLINKVANLATQHIACHTRLHNSKGLSELPQKAVKKILGFREKLGK